MKEEPVMMAEASTVKMMVNMLVRISHRIFSATLKFNRSIVRSLNAGTSANIRANYTKRHDKKQRRPVVTRTNNSLKLKLTKVESILISP